MTRPSPDPSLQQYPGYFPAKIAAWKRKWVQITAASLLAFLIGSGVGAAGQEAPTAPVSAARTKAPVALTAQLKDVKTKLGKAEQEESRLRSELNTTKSKWRQAVASVRAKARTEKRAAVRRAVVKAKAQQKQAVAAAVAQAKNEAEAQAEAQTARPANDEPAATGAGLDPQFRYCYEANDAGYGDYQQGVDPEYDWYDDNDGDGVVCER